MNDSDPLVDVRLFLCGDLLDPVQVTSMLGTTGSKMRVKGEKWRTSTNHEITAKTGLWSLEAKAESPSLSDQISWPKQKLSSAACSPLKIPGVQEAEVSVYISLGPNDRGGGDYTSLLAVEDLVWLSGLGVPVSFALTYIQNGPGIASP